MKTRTHSYFAFLIAAAALTPPVARADDSRLWREQIPASRSVLLTLEPAGESQAAQSDDWLWREQVFPSPALGYLVRTTAKDGPPDYALWREQVRHDVKKPIRSVAQSIAESTRE